MLSSAGMNVTTLILTGVGELLDHRWVFLALFLSTYVFVLLSDSLVVYIIYSQPRLHRPMFIFVAAVLLNSLAGTMAFYPKLLSDLASGRAAVQISRAACLAQTFTIYSVGASSFMLLAAMAFDRYVSICHPLRYATIMSPTGVAVLLLFCWLFPSGMVGTAILLAGRVPLCSSHLHRAYCDVYSFVSIGCSGGAVALLQLYGLLCSGTTVLMPVLFVLFSYSRILVISLRGAKGINTRALHTCVPHLLVFLNYALCTAAELLQRRLQTQRDTTVSILSSILMFLIPNVCNPVVYGLKMKDVFAHVKKLLQPRKDAQATILK